MGRPSGISLIGRSLTLDGLEEGQALSPDGTRAVITTDATNWNVGGFATQIAVINTTTGKQVGVTLALDGLLTGSPPLVSPDGTRAVITVRPAGDGARVMVIDTASGNQVGSTFTLAGQDGTPTFLTADGRRAVVTTTSNDAISGGTRLAVIDTATGTQIGTTLVSPRGSSVLSAGGDRALVITTGGDANVGFTTRVTVIDTTTASQTGAPLTLKGRLNSAKPVVAVGQQADTGGNRVLIATEEFDSTGAATTRLAIIDTADGTQVGALTLAGSTTGAPLLLCADGDRVILTATDEQLNVTRVAVVDTATGEQVGTTTTFSSRAFDGDVSLHGTRALIELNGEVAVIDSTTGNAALVSLPNGLRGEPILSTDATRALLADNAGGAVIVNLITGAQTNLPVLPDADYVGFEVVNADGTRAVIATEIRGAPAGGGSARVAVIDTATGAQIGSGFTIEGAGVVVPRADGKSALIATAVVEPVVPGLVEAYTARLAVIDVATGQQIGTTRRVTGARYFDIKPAGAGTRALFVTYPGMKTKMALIDTGTGNAGLRTVTLNGEYGGAPLLSADGTRAVISTYRRGEVGTTTIRVAALG